MRTLKKTLCLVLCLAMMAGLCVFASADFKDQDKIENEEAVAVLTGIGVINGDDKGNFNPEGTLTRAEATVIITKLLGAADIKATTDAFTDVKADYWGMPYIAYCVAEGVVAGMGDGTFAPNAKLTGYQWATLLLRAIGYKIEGESWQIDVAKLVKSLGLAEGMTFNGVNEITREDACQMAFNALFVQTVHYEGGSKVTVGGVEIVTDSKLVKETYEYTEGGVTKTAAETLAHTYFPTLKTASDIGDDFGRPVAVKWTYGKKAETIYKESAAPAYTFTASADKTLGSDGDKLATYINDTLKLTKNEKVSFVAKTAAVEGTVFKMNGLAGTTYDISEADEIEVYLEEGTTKIALVVVTSYTFSQVTAIKPIKKLTEAEEDMGATAKVKLSGVTDEIYDAQFAGFNYEEGEYVLIVADSTGKEIIASKAAELVEGKVEATKGTHPAQQVRVNGEWYVNATAAALTIAAKDAEASVYALDETGAIAAVVSTPKNVTLDEVYYVVGTYKRTTTDDYGATTETYFVQVVDLKGNISSVQVENQAAGDALKGKLASFAAVSKKDYKVGTEYTTKIGSVTGQTLTPTSKRIGNYYITSATKFIVVETKVNTLGITQFAKTKATVSTGSISYTGVNAWVAYSTSGANNVADYVVVTAGTADDGKTAYSDKLYLTSTSAAYTTAEGDWYTVYTAAGEKKDIIIDATASSTMAVGYNTYEIDKDGVYTLKAAATSTVANYKADTKKAVVLAGVTYEGFFEDLLTVKDTEAVDLAAEKAVVVDVHDTKAAGQYKYTIDSLDEIDALKADGDIKVVTMSIDVSATGIVTVFITSVTTA